MVCSSVHVVVFWLLFLPQASEDRDFRKSQISCANSWVPRGVVDLSGRIKTEKENNQEAEDWRYVHGFSITDGKSPKRGWRAERRAAGVATANQKEGFQPEFWAVRFDLIPISAWLSGWTGTRSKRNFHRLASNCGMALNSRCRVLIVFPRWPRLRIRSPRRSRDSVPQTRKQRSILSL